jgi:hypothetical protein
MRRTWPTGGCRAKTNENCLENDKTLQTSKIVVMFIATYRRQQDLDLGRVVKGECTAVHVLN